MLQAILKQAAEEILYAARGHACIHAGVLLLARRWHIGGILVALSLDLLRELNPLAFSQASSDFPRFRFALACRRIGLCPIGHLEEHLRLGLSGKLAEVHLGLFFVL